MHTRLNQILTRFATLLAVVAACGTAPATRADSSIPLLAPPNWSDTDPVLPNRVPLADHHVARAGGSGQPAAPALPAPDAAPTEEFFRSGVIEENCQPRGVRPYGGGSPGDWSWGCGGSPYRTGPGLCDDWKVGCRWHVAADGIVLSREDANLAGLTAATDEDSAGNPLVDPMLEQFDYGPGGRVAFMSQVPHYVGYQMYFAYEGVEEWNSSVVWPKFSPMPGSADPFTSEQRALHYRSSFHSAEINFVRFWHSMLQPFCGVRYIKFDDEINDFINQEAPLGTVTNDRLNLFDLQNDLIGFQVGGGYQLGEWGERLAIVGFFNGGVYYNKIKYTNLMGIFTTAADGTSSAVLNNDVSELSEIAYVTESSITAICRLNRCWALRTGYQALWIANLHLAEDAFLDTGDEDENLFFHGWHAGIECRR